MSNNIIDFPNEVKNNLDNVIKDTIDKCNIKEPFLLICSDCGKHLDKCDIGSKEIEFKDGAVPIYTCKKCASINDAIFDFLSTINQIYSGETGVRCDWKDFMSVEIKKLLSKKTPVKYIKKHRVISKFIED